MAIGKLTGTHIPFKSNDFGQEHGLQLLSFDCKPQSLHFPGTGSLIIQAKVYCSSGEMGKPESTYVVEFSAVQDISGEVCFKATGRFALSPVFFTKAIFHSSLATGDVATVWKKVDVNGDGSVSREDLEQFINSAGLSKKSVDMPFRDISFKQFACIFATLQQNYYGASVLNASGITALKSQRNIRDGISITPIYYTDTALINSHNTTVAFV